MDAGRGAERVGKEGKALRPLPRERMQECRETRVRVTRSGAFTLGKVFYTLPSRMTVTAPPTDRPSTAPPAVWKETLDEPQAALRPGRRRGGPDAQGTAHAHDEGHVATVRRTGTARTWCRSSRRRAATWPSKRRSGGFTSSTSSSSTTSPTPLSAWERIFADKAQDDRRRRPARPPCPHPHPQRRELSPTSRRRTRRQRRWHRRQEVAVRLPGPTPGLASTTDPDSQPRRRHWCGSPLNGPNPGVSQVGSVRDLSLTDRAVFDRRQPPPSTSPRCLVPRRSRVRLPYT